jgi:hypothetical protein
MFGVGPSTKLKIVYVGRIYRGNHGCVINVVVNSITYVAIIINFSISSAMVIMQDRYVFDLFMRLFLDTYSTTLVCHQKCLLWELRFWRNRSTVDIFSDFSRHRTKLPQRNLSNSYWTPFLKNSSDSLQLIPLIKQSSICFIQGVGLTSLHNHKM